MVAASSELSTSAKPSPVMMLYRCFIQIEYALVYQSGPIVEDLDFPRKNGCPKEFVSSQRAVDYVRIIAG